VNAVPIITGLGLVTPLGRSAQQTWQALLDGQSIHDHARLESPIKSISRVSGLAIEAAREAVSHSQWAEHPVAKSETALVVGTSKGPIENWIPSDNLEISIGCSNFGLAQLAADISRHIQSIDGPVLTLSAACASGLHALIRAAMMIQNREVARVLVVAAEASVHPLFLASFRRLGVLPPPGEPCRPFDENRRGFLMSEAAAAICLESSESSSRPIATIERFAMGSDATHLTAGDPQGQTLRRLLNQVIDNRPVDLIHAHGTGTIFNDPVELAAIESALQNVRGEPSIIYSHKAALGHSLGAAGLISIVLNCMSHRTGQVPANVNTPHPLTTRAGIIANQPIHRPIRRSLACASGFGGTIAALSLTSG
jgi:3-oxoacyl-[acyl-carrier-protein] synthase II